MLRRYLLVPMVAVCALLLAGPAAAQPNKTLRVVMHSDLKILDPIWTTAYIVRNHGYLIYDTLFALDDKLKPQPQMVESWTVSDDYSSPGPSSCATASNGRTASLSHLPTCYPRSSALPTRTRWAAF